MNTKKEQQQTTEPSNDLYALLGNVVDVLTTNRDVTYYDEQVDMQKVFEKRYGFKCKLSLAHEIILTIRKTNIDQTFIIMDYFRHKRYGFSPNVA